MKTSLDCTACFVRQALAAARLASVDPALHERVVRAALETVAAADLDLPPPAIGRQIHRLVCEATGDPDPYRAIKQHYNSLVASLLPGLRHRVAAAVDPFEAAVRLAIAGNVIDFGAPGEVSAARLGDTIEHCMVAALDRRAIDDLRHAAQQAATVLLLADNAGEIALDLLLLEQLRALGPAAELVVAVRGAAVLNDATREDAAAVGLGAVATRVIDNGSDVPGTLLSECSDTFRRAYGAAGLVIAKGQGNFETLCDTAGREVFFLFQAKCEVVTRLIGCGRNTPLVVRVPRAARAPSGA